MNFRAGRGKVHNRFQCFSNSVVTQSERDPLLNSTSFSAEYFFPLRFQRRLKPRKRRRFHFHLTPTGSSWLNQVERWFGLIADKMIRRGTFHSVEELEAFSEGNTWAGCRQTGENRVESCKYAGKLPRGEDPSCARTRGWCRQCAIWPLPRCH